MYTYVYICIGHILTKEELQVLSRLLAAYSDEKLKDLKVVVQEKHGGDISREEVEQSLRGNGFPMIADSLKEGIKKG